MSQENVEIAKRAVDAFNRGDMDGALALLDPNVRWTTADDEPDPQTYVGHEGVRQLIASLLDIWERGFTMEAHEFIDLGDVVVVPFTSHVQARGSGVALDAEETHVFTVHDGKIVRVREYRTKDAALQALGMLE
jgi:ketosteroid isomerase-like protein